MAEHTETYLIEIIFRTNMLLDRGETATFEEVHQSATSKSIVPWLSGRGSDMSILLSPSMSDERSAVEDALANASEARQGREMRKMGVQNNGLCLLIGLAVEAIAINA